MTAARKTETTLVPPPELTAVTYEPVFIMGDHRSGTTLLYQLLASSGAFNITTTYHVICDGEMLATHQAGRTDEAKAELNERFKSLNLNTRLIDEMELNAETPEEYGLILHRRTGKLTLTPKTFSAFDEICRTMQLVSGHPERPLLLKNPWDFSAFMTVHQLFPRAKMVFIHRHPVHVLNSQLKAMHKNWSEGNPYVSMMSETFARMQRKPLARRFMYWVTDPHSRVRLAQRIVTRRAVQSANYFLKNIDRLPQEQYVSLGYEEMCRDANREIGRVLEFLNVTSATGVDFQAQISPRPTRLLPGLERAAASLERQFQHINAYHGYTGPP